MTNLSAHFEAIALGELGPPHSKRGTEWRYGTHGSLSLCTRKGVWFDHEANEGGGIVGTGREGRGDGEVAGAGGEGDGRDDVHRATRANATGGRVRGRDARRAAG